MTGAKQIFAVTIEEAVWDPIKRRTGMRAPISIDDRVAAPPQHDEFALLGAVADRDAFGAALRNRGQFDERRLGAQGFTPAISDSIFQCSSLTGTTERRD